MAALEMDSSNPRHLLGVTLRVFLATVLGMAALGLALAGGAWYALRDRPSWGLLLAAVVFAEALAAGALLGAWRALSGALTHAVTTWRPGRALVGLCFAGLAAGEPRRAEDGPSGAGPALARLPLAQAERRLREVVAWVLRTRTADAGRQGWWRRRIEKRLLDGVEKITLARFRATGAATGAVDLAALEADLAARVDALLGDRLRRSARLWTALVVLGLVALAAGETWLVAWLMVA